MDDVRIGRLLRALRKRKHLRQQDVASSAGISQSAVSLMERGHLATLSIRTVRAAFSAVDARFEGLVTWRGGAIDRLLDERHASLVGQVAQDLQRAGWEVHVEVTFAQFGERGSIDIVGLRRMEGIVLIVEIKTELTAIDDTIRRLDVKDRLASRIVQERFGWRPATVTRVLVVLDGTTARRRVAAHDHALRVAFPDRGARTRAWLRHPVGRLSGLLFVGPRTEVRAPNTNGSDARAVGGTVSEPNRGPSAPPATSVGR